MLLRGWENLRSQIGNHNTLEPGGVLYSSAVFLLETPPENYETVKGLMLVIVDYSGKQTKHRITLETRWFDQLKRGFTLIDEIGQ